MISRIDIEDMTDAQDEARNKPVIEIRREYSMPDIIQIGDLVKIAMNGTVTYGPNYTPDEAAKVFWDALARAGLLRVARPSQAGDESVARLVEAARCVDLLPPGEWETWTSCSFRRITAKGGPDGGVLSALTHRSDGHPDLSWNERQCRVLCDLVNGLRAALAAMDTPKGGGDE